MSRKISTAAIGAAVSLLFIVLSRFVPSMKLTFTVLATVGTIIPMSRGYVRESALASIAVIILGAIIVQTSVIPYVLLGSFYTILTIWAKRKGIKIFITLPLKVLYAALVFYVVYTLTGLLVIDLDKLTFFDGLSETAIFFVLDAVFIVAFLVFDFIVLELYEYIGKRLEKLS